MDLENPCPSMGLMVDFVGGNNPGLLGFLSCFPMKHENRKIQVYSD